MRADVSAVVLSFDVLDAISKELFHIGGQQDLFALCLVSKQANQAATRWLYRSFILDFKKSKNPHSFLTCNIASYRPLVNGLTVQGLNPHVKKTAVRNLIAIIPCLPNLQNFVWRATAPIPRLLMKAAHAHPGVKEIEIQSCFFCDGGGAGNWFDPDHRCIKAGKNLEQVLFDLIPVRSTIHTKSNCQDLCFTGYQFPPGHDALRYMDLSTLRDLQLINCTNIGYLFNNLLCNIAKVQLRSLKIDLSGMRSGAGYIGREKIEYFLAVHDGLEELFLSNMGGDRPRLQTILAQGSALEVLIIRQSDMKDPTALEKAQPGDELHGDPTIRKACPKLRSLVIDVH